MVKLFRACRIEFARPYSTWMTYYRWAIHIIDYHFCIADEAMVDLAVLFVNKLAGTLLRFGRAIKNAMMSQINSVSIVYSIGCSGADKKKTSKFRVIGLCEGNSPVTGEFPAQRANNVSIWWRHHGWVITSHSRLPMQYIWKIVRLRKYAYHCKHVCGTLPR